jgi:RNA polymerase sigma-70 factor (ECF subfamily)
MKLTHLKCSDRNRSDRGARHFSAEAKEERDFVAAAKTGDSVAFEVLCTQSAGMLFNMARRLTLTKEDAEDVVQESFQLAFINLKKFRGDSRFSTWLTSIVTNAALMRLRKSRVRHEMPLEASSESQTPFSPFGVEDRGLNPEQLYAQKERHRMLVQAVSELDSRLRSAIELRDLGERSTDEAARIMGMHINTLKARLFRGRRKLRQLLNHMEPVQVTRKRTVGGAGRSATVSLNSNREDGREFVEAVSS